jgi:hypothetical protein
MNSLERARLKVSIRAKKTAAALEQKQDQEEEKIPQKAVQNPVKERGFSRLT